MAFLGLFKHNRRRHRKRQEPTRVINNIAKRSVVLNRLNTPSPSPVKTRDDYHQQRRLSRLNGNTPLKELKNEVKRDFIDNKGNLEPVMRRMEQIQRDFEQNKICRERKSRKLAIMKQTKGKGVRVKHANWSINSLIRCK